MFEKKKTKKLQLDKIAMLPAFLLAVLLCPAFTSGQDGERKVPGEVSTAKEGPSPQRLVPEVACVQSPFSFSNTTPTAINDVTTATSTVTVSGAGAHLENIDLATFITHTFPADIDMTLTSPAGTIVTITSDNGGGNDNIFNGTYWTDLGNPRGSAPYPNFGNPGLVTDHPFTNNIVAGRLAPEEPFSAFRGENPNGTWTLRIHDDTNGDPGTLNRWSLNLRTLPSAPVINGGNAGSPFNTTPNLPIPDNNTGFVFAEAIFSGFPTHVDKVVVRTTIPHTFSGDIVATLRSPSGTVVTLTSGNGGSNDNVFNGTTWDDDLDPGNQLPFPNSTFAASNLVTDTTYANLTTRVSLVSEESLGAFRGETMNGAWRLTVSDNEAGDTGTLAAWGLTITTNSCDTSAPRSLPSSDFDGDGLTDPSIFRPSVGEWYYLSSLAGNSPGAQFGASSDKIAPADFTGDGKADFAFFRPSDASWYILRSENQTFFAFPYGINGDIPAPGDFDGDGKADVTIFRPSAGLWASLRSSNQQSTILQFGANGDIPVVADYDGDGKADFSVYRPSAGEWYTRRSSNNSVFGAPFGAVGDKPVQGDYTGDGKADFAIFRPSTRFWYVLRSENQSFFGSQFGLSTDTPTIGDYDGDGRNDFAVFRPSTGNWFVQRSSNGSLLSAQFGIATDRPAPAYYLP